MKMTRIVLADDQLLIRAGIRAVMETLPGYQIEAECADGHEAIEAIQRLTLNRDAKDRHERVRRGHAWQMSGATGAGDDDFDPARLGRLRELDHPVGRAMRRDDLALVGDTELGQDVGRVLHRLPVGARAHDDGYQRFCVCHDCFFILH